MAVSAPGTADTTLAQLGLIATPQVDGDRTVWLVSGNTFAMRGRLKRLGGRWSSARKCWVFDELPTSDSLAVDPEPRAAATSGLQEASAGLTDKGWGSKHYHGHRERLRQRCLETAGKALADYEILELLLFFSVYRRDTKPLAKALIARFGSLGGVLAAEHAALASVPGLGVKSGEESQAADNGNDDDLKFTQVLLRTVHEINLRVAKEQITERPVIASWTALIDYLTLAMVHEVREHFRILFLDRKNILLRDEVQSQGTVDHTPLYPREVVKRALELGASAIIMVHNHPSGDPTPSKADVEMTRQVISALETVGITVHDHVIVGKNRHTSFRSERLI